MSEPTTSKKIKVLIIGGSLTGLILAYKLKYNKNIEITLVEKREQYDYSIGGGMTSLLGYAFSDLRDNMLLPITTLIKPSTVIAQFMDSKGKAMQTIKLEKLLKGANNMGVTYYSILLKALVAESSKVVDNFKMGTVLTELEDEGEKVCATLYDTVLKNYIKEDFDLVFGCDGIGSTVRRLAFGKDCEIHTKVTYVTFAVECDESNEDIWENLNSSTGYFTLSCGAHYFISRIGEKQVTFCGWFLNPNNRNLTPENVKAVLLQAFKGNWLAEELINAVKKPSCFYTHNYTNIKLKQWYKNRIILVGDAAYGFGCDGDRSKTLTVLGPSTLSPLIIAFATNKVTLEEACKNYQQSLEPKTNAEKKYCEGFVSQVEISSKKPISIFRDVVLKSIPSGIISSFFELTYKASENNNKKIKKIKAHINQSNSFEEILKDNIARKELLVFAKKDFAQESIQFLIEVQNYTDLKNKEERKVKADEIINLYVEQEAKYAINISKKIVEECKKNVNEVGDTLFDDCKSDIKLLVNDMFTRWKEMYLNP